MCSTAANFFSYLHPLRSWKRLIGARAGTSAHKKMEEILEDTCYEVVVLDPPKGKDKDEDDKLSVVVTVRFTDHFNKRPSQHASP